MARERSREPAARVSDYWQFQPRGRADIHREEARAFGRRLDAALRAGHGLGAELALRLRAGAEPSLQLAAESGVARRWIPRILLPAFDHHPWSPGRSSSSSPTVAEVYGRRIRPWPHSLGGLPESVSILDVWAATASSLPSTLALEIRFRPLPLSAPGWWEFGRGDDETRAVPFGVGRPPPAGRAVRPAPPVPAPSTPIGWEVQVRLSASAPLGEAAPLRAAATAFERGARNAIGNGVAFDHHPRRAPSSGRWFMVAHEELELFFPGPEYPAFPTARSSPPGGEVLPLGRTAAGTVVGAPIDVGQGRHLAVLGETGMGKSSLLVALARRVSRAHGLVLLDPLGGTAQSLERELGSSARTRLVRIDPVQSPLSVNALEGIQVDEHGDRVRSERRLNDLIHSLRRVRSGRYTDSTYWGPRLEEMLSRAVRAAAALPQGTLVDAHTLLATGARLRREIPSEALGPVRELADRIRERPEDAEGARRLLYEIVRSPVLEGMLCDRTPDLRASELVAPGRIVVVSGNAGAVGESAARYLSSVYLALVWSEILSRPNRSKVFVVLDETQWFSHESLTEMLRLGRSTNLHVILATQAVASLPEPIAESVWTNVADFVAFRGSPDEAREIARAAGGVSTEAILSLPRGQAAVLLGKGRSVQWLRTLRLPDPGAVPARTPSARPPISPPEVPPGSSSRMVPTVSPGPEIQERSPPTIGAALIVDPEQLLEELRGRARGLPRDSPLRVELEELRQNLDPSGLAIRRVGSELGRTGAILATERTPSGTIWTLDPSRFPPPLDDSHSPDGTRGDRRKRT